MNETIRYLQSIPSTDDPEIGALVNAILRDAVQAEASDIHLEPWESTLVVRVRLGGVLRELIHLPIELLDKVAGRFKVMANLVSYQTDLPQEGHAPTDEEIGVELRISVFPTVRGEKVVVRIFDPRNRSFDLAGLGFEDGTLDEMHRMLSHPNGLLLLTGPTGSGKTTAIYAALTYLVNRHGPTISISTVEDPVECRLSMVSQAQVNPAREFTYPRALRSLMRQDPEVIMIGEIRDPETANIAVQAGLTGHLVISTIHAGSTAGVFARLINMDIEPFLLSSAIVGVLGLRLIRLICPDCRRLCGAEAAHEKHVPAGLLAEATLARGEGCPRCLETGYFGRSALTEILSVNDVLREAVLERMPTRALQHVAVEQGMRTLWVNGLDRVIRGQTTIEEILRVLAADSF